MSFTLLAASEGPSKVGGGIVLVVIGGAMLVFARRISSSLIAGQRAAVGTMLGGHRKRSDAIHDSAFVRVAGTVYVVAFGAIFFVGGVALIAKGL